MWYPTSWWTYSLKNGIHHHGVFLVSILKNIRFHNDKCLFLGLNVWTSLLRSLPVIWSGWWCGYPTCSSRSLVVWVPHWKNAGSSVVLRPSAQHNEQRDTCWHWGYGICGRCTSVTDRMGMAKACEKLSTGFSLTVVAVIPAALVYRRCWRQRKTENQDRCLLEEALFRHLILLRNFLSTAGREI